MKKRIVVYFLLFFFLFGTGGLSTYAQNTTDNKNQEERTLYKPTVTYGSTSEDAVTVFCQDTSSGKEDSIKRVNRLINKLIAETYGYTYGSHIVATYNKGRVRENVITPYDAGVSAAKMGSKGNGLLSALEADCQKYRSESVGKSNEIDGLYKQAQFLERYYRTVPLTLKQGILPTFLLFLIDVLDTVLFYCIILSVFNIIFWTILYTMRPTQENSENYLTRIKYGFWYFILLFIIRLGVLGTIMGIIGFEGLDFVRIFVTPY